MPARILGGARAAAQGISCRALVGRASGNTRGEHTVRRTADGPQPRGGTQCHTDAR